MTHTFDSEVSLHSRLLWPTVCWFPHTMGPSINDVGNWEGEGVKNRSKLPTDSTKKNSQYVGGWCQKFRKISDVVYGWSQLDNQFFWTTNYNKLLHSTSRWKGCPRHGQRNPLLWWLPPTWAGPTHFSRPRRRHVAMRRRRQPTWVRISRTSTCKIYLMVCVISPVLYIAPIIEPMRSSHGIHGILTASR